MPHKNQALFVLIAYIYASVYAYIEELEFQFLLYKIQQNDDLDKDNCSYILWYLSIEYIIILLT